MGIREAKHISYATLIEKHVDLDSCQLQELLIPDTNSDLLVNLADRFHVVGIMDDTPTSPAIEPVMILKPSGGWYHKTEDEFVSLNGETAFPICTTYCPWSRRPTDENPVDPAEIGYRRWRDSGRVLILNADKPIELTEDILTATKR